MYSHTAITKDKQSNRLCPSTCTENVRLNAALQFKIDSEISILNFTYFLFPAADSLFTPHLWISENIL